MLKKIQGFFVGYFMSILAMLFLGAIGWLSYGDYFGEPSKFIIAAISAGIVWSCVYFLTKIFKFLAILVAYISYGIGFIFMIPLWAYVGFMLTNYVLPDSWFVLSTTEFMGMIGPGLLFLIIDLVVDRGSGKKKAKVEVK